MLPPQHLARCKMTHIYVGIGWKRHEQTWADNDKAVQKRTAESWNSCQGAMRMESQEALFRADVIQCSPQSGARVIILKHNQLSSDLCDECGVVSSQQKITSLYYIDKARKAVIDTTWDSRQQHCLGSKVQALPALESTRETNLCLGPGAHIFEQPWSWLDLACTCAATFVFLIGHLRVSHGVCPLLGSYV